MAIFIIIIIIIIIIIVILPLIKMAVELEADSTNDVIFSQFRSRAIMAKFRT